MEARTVRSRFILSLLAAGLAWGGQLQAATLYFAHTDAQGSVVAVTDSTRQVVERREYEPYGLPRAPVTDDPGYTGHVHDADSSLVYMQQRYYDPEVGRFLSVDPVGVSNAGGNFNRYWYANNNPYTFVDPDGMFPGFPGGGNTDCSTFVVCPGEPERSFSASSGDDESEQRKRQAEKISTSFTVEGGPLTDQQTQMMSTMLTDAAAAILNVGASWLLEYQSIHIVVGETPLGPNSELAHVDVSDDGQTGTIRFFREVFGYTAGDRLAIFGHEVKHLDPPNFNAWQNRGTRRHADQAADTYGNALALSLYRRDYTRFFSGDGTLRPHRNNRRE